MLSLVQVFLSIYSFHIFKNPLALFPVYLEIAGQVGGIEAQAFFFSIKDKTIVAVIC